MARTMGRRSGSQQGRRRDEEYGRDDASRAPGDNRQQDTDSLIADMAKGFVEAQAKIAAAPAGDPNREMMDLLEKISRQLAQMQALSAAGQSREGQQQADDAQENAGSRQAQAGSQGKGGQADLSAIFSRLLSADKSENAAQQGGDSQGGGSRGQGGQQAQDGSGSGRQGQSGSQQQGGQPGSQSVTARTAAQALAQAQYELANELEASLSKLKQVISESEKLADRISNLLGQEGGSRQT